MTMVMIMTLVVVVVTIFDDDDNDDFNDYMKALTGLLSVSLIQSLQL